VLTSALALNVFTVSLVLSTCNGSTDSFPSSCRVCPRFRCDANPWKKNSLWAPKYNYWPSALPKISSLSLFWLSHSIMIWWGKYDHFAVGKIAPASDCMTACIRCTCQQYFVQCLCYALLGDQCCLGNPSRVKCWFLGRKQIASKFPMMRVDTSISTRRSPRLERHWNLLKTQFYLQGLVNGVEFSDCGNKKFGYIPSTFDCLTVS
jgi:hypothetical protein